MTIGCIGELLWDLLPDGRLLGGAPLNVAAHLSMLGQPAVLISRIGEDEPGRAALRQLGALGLDATWVQRDATLPTGNAAITLDEQGCATYGFVTPAAWDAITPAGPDCDTVVFGTLAQRNATSRAAIRTLVARAASRVLDVNLRAPYDTPEVVIGSIAAATILKLSDDELPRLATWLDTPLEPQPFCAAVMRRFGLEAVVVTRGPRGACALAAGNWHESPSAPARVVDTVGAGDAFLAGLLSALRTGAEWPAALTQANELARAVASQAGALPAPRP